ncbi:MAG: MBL fold metallo-hydrolase [Candidatus Aenigmatarchaeota archaeon]
MTKITFLGTGGGRFVVITQLRATGGWVLEMDGQMLHIDPGPGALVRAKQCKAKLRKLTGVLCSHAHPEHYTDLEVVIEAMTEGATERRGVLIASEHVLKGGGNYRQVVSPYHQKVVEKVVMLKPEGSTRVGDIKVTATPTKHGEAKGIGFVFKGSHTVGYTSDGEYFPGMEKHYRRCDCLIMNVLRPRGVTWPQHMNTGDAAKLVARAKPKLAVIQHFGMLALKAGPEKEAAWVQKETGVKTVAARDGMVLELGKKPGKAPLSKYFK